ncbi:MAG: hypothetical protein HYZ22_09040 [Chloroflexi bacterium]|nr:hypothetical protein [Chloroflexota bacterium]
MKRLASFLYPVIGASLVVLVILTIVNRDLPLIGRDYGYHIPRMLDGLLHQKINGLTFQWYTPSFGGGIPAYPNPQDIQFSLPQILLHEVNPWIALMVSLSVYSIVGFTTFYFFLFNECGFDRGASMLGAAFILANGFFIEHAIVGHVGFQVFPLLGLILYLLFSSQFEALTSGFLLGIVGWLLVNQSGFYIIYIFALSSTILLPLMYLLTPHLFNWKRLGSVLLFGLSSVFALSASKLWAVYSFMRFFPREIADQYSITYSQGMAGIALQLAGGMIVIPYYFFTGQNLNELPGVFQNATGNIENGMWETDISISPILILLLVYGIFRKSIAIFQKRAELSWSRSGILAFLFILLSTWLSLDLSLAQGWLFSFLKDAPVIRSLHVNVRYPSAFIFPMAFAGTYIFDKFIKQIKPNLKFLPAFLFIMTILLPLWYLVPEKQIQDRVFNIRQMEKIYAKITEREPFPVTNIANVNDIQVLLKDASNLQGLFEPLFGYNLEYFHPDVHVGPVQDIENGYFNLTNPASYVYPDENSLKPFERFRVDQAEEFNQFINRRQPKLMISTGQHMANIITIKSAAIMFLYFCYRIIRLSLRRKEQTLKAY